MKIDIVSLFPTMFEGFLHESIIKRAIEQELVEINIVNLRNYSDNKHNKVDDTPYGGGAGMVLQVEPVYKCIEDLKTEDSKVIMMTPQGYVYNQTFAKSFTTITHMIILCGHYEGFDERIRNYVDLEISIGDFVLTGGEVPAMLVCDSVIRLLEGVIETDSHLDDSHSNWMLEHPHYTKPRVFMDQEVPEVLLSGNHKLIEDYRKRESVRRTYLRRPDLLEKKELSVEEKFYLELIINEENKQ